MPVAEAPAPGLLDEAATEPVPVDPTDFGSAVNAPAPVLPEVAPGRPSWVTDILPYYLSDTLPSALRPFDGIIRAAAATKFPCRNHNWESYEKDSAGKPMRSGSRAHDPNDIIRSSANSYLLCFERAKSAHFETEKARRDNEARGKEHLANLRYWSGELTEMLAAIEVLEAAQARFFASAPTDTLAPVYEQSGRWKGGSK